MVNREETGFDVCFISDHKHCRYKTGLRNERCGRKLTSHFHFHLFTINFSLVVESCFPHFALQGLNYYREYLNKSEISEMF